MWFRAPLRFGRLTPADGSSRRSATAVLPSGRRQHPPSACIPETPPGAAAGCALALFHPAAVPKWNVPLWNRRRPRDPAAQQALPYSAKETQPQRSASPKINDARRHYRCHARPQEALRGAVSAGQVPAAPAERSDARRRGCAAGAQFSLRIPPRFVSERAAPTAEAPAGTSRSLEPWPPRYRCSEDQRPAAPGCLKGADRSTL